MKKAVTRGILLLVVAVGASSCGSAGQKVAVTPSVIKERTDYSKLLAPYRKQLENDYGRFLREAREVQSECGD